MRDSKSPAQEVVDFGTSPHGLSADLPLPHQETRPAESLDSLVDQQAPQGRAAGFDLAGTMPRSGAAGEPTGESVPECYRGLRGKVLLAVTPAAAWWYEFVGGLSVELAHWPAAFVWRFISRSFSRRVDNFVQALVRFLLAQELMWPIAEPYLRAKWQLEDEAAARRYYAEHPERRPA